MDVARSIRGDLPDKAIESHVGYTQRGRAYTIAASRASTGLGSPGHSRCPQVEVGVVSSQAATVAATGGVEV